MSFKSVLDSVFHRTAPLPPEQESQATQATVDKLTRELAACEIDTRFREALAAGEIAGDIVELDEHGNDLRKTKKRSNIFGS